MTRLEVRRRGGVALWMAAAMLLAGCAGEPDTGPVEIKWDRDTCIRCSMIISDRHFAAVARGGPKKRAFKFDDIGCAVHWLAGQPWGKDPATEIWVIDHKEGKWIDARTARYVEGKASPMGYNFAAYGADRPGSIGFEEMRQKVLAQK
jgi:nitrous oxide reductase accessory protein NosL